uniref:Uncharacterized protein n=1 Tax=Chenopodium quinoa TaxID=63459 RepID=A0A803L9X5_CHEQI
MEVMEQPQEPLEPTNSVVVYENEEKRLKHLDFVEATVENIVVFLKKVDEFIHEIDWRQESLPKLMTHVTKKAAEVTRELAMEIQATGLLDATANAAKEAYLTYKPVAKDMIIRYEPVAEEYAVWAWQLCKQVSVLAQVSQLMVPTAAFWAERYNTVVDFTAESGLPMAHYLPLIPLEKIAKVFAEADENGF